MRNFSDFIGSFIPAIIAAPFVVPGLFFKVLSSPFTVLVSKPQYSQVLFQVMHYLLPVVALVAYYYLYKKQYAISFAVVLIGIGLLSFKEYLPVMYGVKETDAWVIGYVPYAIVFTLFGIGLLASKLLVK